MTLTISKDNAAYTAKTAATGAVIGAGVNAAYRAGKVLVPVAKDSFNKSIQGQANNIAKMSKAGSKEKVLEEFKNSVDMMFDVRKGAEKLASVADNKKDQFAEVMKKKAEHGRKYWDKQAKVLENILDKGKPSKVQAAKTSISSVGETIANKFTSFKEAFKSCDGAIAKAGFIKDKAIGAAKKSAKPALIGMAALTLVTTGAKVLSNHKAKNSDK